jgi:hypothetical protein
MNKYTVLMIVPDYIASSYGEETYMAYVEAETVEEAQLEAQDEAYKDLVEEPDRLPEDNPEDFFVVFACHDHVKDIHIW